jgi:(1->4)-alpha-D-glucan 1-alpha-D-glucosylmutase
MTIPIRATYRLQLHSGFTLESARAIVPYLAKLGISHIYASPVLRSRPGSTHGYDVVDPTRLDPELGSDASWDALVSELRAHDMGIILDIVPNHMGVGADNPFWDDLFANGPASRYASWFDIDWNAPARGMKGRVLIPILGKELSASIEAREITLAFDAGRFRIRYFDQSFPLDPATLPAILDHAMADPESELSSPEFDALARISESLATLPPRLTARRRLVERRQKEAPEQLRTLEALAAGSRPVQRVLERAAETFADDSDGRARLQSLLDAQVYALVFWRRAAHEINYRRFFDINELVAMRMEDPAVFGATHRRIIQWVKNGQLDGLRIDHIDGLRNPRDYLERLDAAIRQVRPDAGIPIYVEKILSGRERLRSEWPVAGTTGYEFLAQLDAIFIDPAGYAAIERTYRDFLGIRRAELDFHEVAVRGKAFILRSSLASDVQRLARLLAPIARRDARTQSLTRVQLAEGIVLLIARLSVYRTYLEAGMLAIHEDDREALEHAFAESKSVALMRAPLHALLEHIFLGDVASLGDERRAERDAFVLRFQQVSGPATAKGIEDTALYRYSPLLSRNEVGADPGDELRDAVGRLHDANIERSTRWPHTLLATSTHDTKRSADVRSRLDALSEIPDEWAAYLARWGQAHRSLTRRVRDRIAPGAHMEYVIYQTLVGVWPVREPDAAARAALCARVSEFARKAAREAKGRTSWADPDEEYERALADFISALFDRPDFLRELQSLVQGIAGASAWNAIARTVLHLTSPGVPDIYQGDELWSYTLVDPDNRRPVSYLERVAVLERIAQMSPSGDIPQPLITTSLPAIDTEELKLTVIHLLLRARAARSALFARGDYRPLSARGPLGDHICAFARTFQSDAVVVVVPRLTRSFASSGAPVGDAWADTVLHLPSDLAGTRWRDAISRREIIFPAPASTDPALPVAVPVASILVSAPVAVLFAEAFRSAVNTPN